MNIFRTIKAMSRGYKLVFCSIQDCGLQKYIYRFSYHFFVNRNPRISGLKSYRQCFTSHYHFRRLSLLVHKKLRAQSEEISLTFLM